MDILFRAFLPNQPRTAPPGELHVRPLLPADEERLALSSIALEKGLDGFVWGDGPTRTIVARLEPTLDDMLAVLILEELLNHRPVPQAQLLAQYSLTLRKGFRPTSKVPLEDSPQGIFRVTRNRANQEQGKRLDDPDTARRFLADWARMAKRLREALAQKLDPREVPIFAGDMEFEAERKYLRNDESIYRRDEERSER
ncbi:MAG TPA: hypothetical protein VGZ47_16645, partial [Gemmataceae bacterium]|nr:hypothetical protein [Gemmataceae bacterium]